MRAAARHSTLAVMQRTFRSGDGLAAFDAEDLVVREWNEALEELTGISAADAVGKRCWEVLRATDESGGLLCHSGCFQVRMARQGHAIPTRNVWVRTAEGKRLLSMATVVAFNGRAECLHLFRNGISVEQPEPAVEPTKLTGRQLEVLRMLADGRSPRVIASELGIAEVTVRNHIRAILLEFRCHSQLAAVAEARRRGIVD